MCGIVGYIGPRDGVPIVMDGLARVEYRGYDSAGIAVVTRKGNLQIHKRKGKLRELRDGLPKRLSGRIAIGHTRWASHGEPSDANAHPHTDEGETVAVVHNGIVENATELRAKLQADGVVFTSETDTEVLAHLVARARRTGLDLEDAVRTVLADVEGAYGLVVIDASQPDRIVAARKGSPVVVGVGEREMFVASDVAAIVRHTKRVVHLDDGEIAVVSADGFHTMRLDATPTEKRLLDVTWNVEDFDMGGFEHFMHKEIHEQPAAVERALRGRLDERFATAHLGGITLTPREVLDIRRIKVLGCGSAYYAGIAGAQLLEALTRIPADAEPASEFRYRNPVVERDALYIAVSQSGETADTIAAVQEVKRKGGRVICVVNVVGSTMAREADGIYMHAGPEVSVASTKAFTSMLVSFALLGLYLGRTKDLGPADGQRLISGLHALPDHIRSVLALEPEIASLAQTFRNLQSMFFIGRNTGYPIALEGAQKLKEISYLHAEAYHASELKHGPLALVGPEFPVVAVLLDGPLLVKNLSTVQEVRARRGRVIGITQSSIAGDAGLLDNEIRIPKNEPELDPILATIPLQLFAYHLAVAMGRDIDQPRNLAKSVTVE